MIDRPNRTAPNGFGKRGTVTMQRQVQGTAATAPAPAPAAAGGAVQLPKWAIGAAAGVFMLVLVSMSGGIGGGGFLGGLLGGMLANKMMNSGKTSPAHVTSQAPSAARSTVAAPAADSMTRGGFGTTASDASRSGGVSMGG